MLNAISQEKQHFKMIGNIYKSYFINNKIEVS